MSHVSYAGARTKFSIGSLDDLELQIDAQYNPKELTISQANTWTGNGALGQESKKALAFTERQSDTVKIELLFDGAEHGGALDPHDAFTVHAAIATLRRLADLRNPNAKSREFHRPHFCVATWGDPAKGMPRFECVIESIEVAYTMFDTSGTVLRATVTLSLKEARRLAGDDAKNDTASRVERAEQRAKMRDARAQRRA